MYRAAVLLLVATIQISSGYPDGAPLCLDKPRHGADPQETDPGLKIKRSKNGSDISINIESDFEFMGFLVRTTAPGEFKYDEEEVQEVQCTGDLESLGTGHLAVSHTNPDPKTAINLSFIQAEGAEQEPDFTLIIVKDFDNYWTDIKI